MSLRETMKWLRPTAQFIMLHGERISTNFERYDESASFICFSENECLMASDDKYFDDLTNADKDSERNSAPSL